MAEAANMQVVPFVKWAYSDVPAFIGFLKAAGEGRVEAAGGANLLIEALGHLKNMGSGALDAVTSHGGSRLPGLSHLGEGASGLGGALGGIGKEMVGTPMNKALTAGGRGAGAASLGVGGAAGVRGLMGGSPAPAPAAMGAKMAPTVQNSTTDIDKITPNKGPGAPSPSKSTKWRLEGLEAILWPFLGPQ